MGSAQRRRSGTSNRAVAVIAASILASSLFACATTSQPTSGQTTLTSATVATKSDGAGTAKSGEGTGVAQAELALAVRSEDDDAEDEPRGFVVVAADVVKRCESVRAVHLKNDDRMAWLTILKSVATCMKDGELRGEEISLTGPARAEMITKSIFDRLGVSDGRIEVEAPANGDDCMDDCTPERMRVEIHTAAAKALSSL